MQSIWAGRVQGREAIIESPSREGGTENVTVLDASIRASADDTLLSQLKSFVALYWSRAGRTKLALLVISIIAVIWVTVVGQLRLNAWYKAFYDAIERRNLDAFGVELLVFAIIAGTLLVLNVAQIWLNQMLKLRTREGLTRDLVEQWLLPKRDVLLAEAGLIARNPDQRIHEDARHLTELSVDLTVGLAQAFLLLISFIGVLWVLSEGVVFTLGGHSFVIAGYMVWCALLYAAIGSFLSWAVGRPLVPLNVERYAREANLRFELVRTNEAIEGISLYRGEANERARLNGEIDRVLEIMRRIVGATTRLTWVTAGYGWLTIVIPIAAAAPGYFEGNLTFGDLMMIVGAFNQVQQSLRWFVDNFGSLADWRATLRRVIGYRQALLRLSQSDAEAGHVEFVEGTSDKLVLEDLAVRFHDGGAVLEPARIEIGPGEHILILAKAGAGKTCLFRAIAGLWPWGSGKIHVPPGARIAFVPQRPYVPPGTLRSTLSYPATSELPDDSTLVAALKRVGLDDFVPLLDTVARWGRDLPLDVQQRLSFVRLLLVKPTFVFLDEVLDVLDDDHYETVCSIFEQELADTAVISFARHKARNGHFTRIVQLMRLAQKHEKN
jgi:putative ATP-binding cassette transporter